MALKRIAQPGALAVSLQAARTAARVDGSSMDADLDQAIRTITDDAEFETQRALIEQEWRLTLERFPSELTLKYPPLVSVTHIRYYDLAGELQTVDPQDYDVDVDSEPGRVILRPGKAWPSVMARFDAIAVTFRCGFGPTDSFVPDGIKGYILRRIADQYGQLSASLAESAPRLLDRYRIY